MNTKTPKAKAKAEKGVKAGKTTKGTKKGKPLTGGDPLHANAKHNVNASPEAKEMSNLIIDRLVPLKFKENLLKKTLLHSYDTFILQMISRLLGRFTIDRRMIGSMFYKTDLILSNPDITNPVHTADNVVTPKIAKRNGFTYAFKLHVKIKQVLEVHDIATKTIDEVVVAEDRVMIAKIPMMVKSSYCTLTYFKESDYLNEECIFDNGGYFIINGRKKQVIPQESLANNKIFVFKRKDQNTKILAAEVRSRSEFGNDTIQTVMIRHKKNNMLTIVIPQLREEVPLVVLLRAIGMTSDKEIIQYICMGKNDKEMLESLIKSFQCYPRVLKPDTTTLNDLILTKDQAELELIQFLRRNFAGGEGDKVERQLIYLRKFLREDLLPHIDRDYNVTSDKAKFLCKMANRLMETVLGRRPQSNRDSYENKYVMNIHDLLSKVFKKSRDKLLREAGRNYSNRADDTQIESKKPPNILVNIRSNLIDKDMNSAITTGLFPVSQNQSIKGVSMDLASKTRVDTLSMQSRIKVPIGESSANMKTVENRLYDNSQAMMICPVETPEGANTGYHKHLSLMTELTIPMLSQVQVIQDFIFDNMEKFGFEFLRNCCPTDFVNTTAIYINGNWIGQVKNPIVLRDFLRLQRRKGNIEYSVGIVFSFQTEEIFISTSGGRFLRPLLRVEDNELVLKKEMLQNMDKSIVRWDDFIAKHQGVIEYLDVDECMESLIAWTPADLEDNRNKQNVTKFDTIPIDNYERAYKRYTHCEFHPYMMFGQVGSQVLFAEYNQSPRNMYQAQMARAAMGIPSTTYLEEENTTLAYSLYYPERPLVTTRAMKWLHTYELPAGQCVNVAFMSYTGFNQEDSVIFNQSAIDRGLFRGTFYRKFDAVVQKNQTTNQMEKFVKPDPNQVSSMRNSSYYSKLTQEGYVPEETNVVGNDVLIGKITPKVVQSNTDYPWKDNSVTMRINTEGIVDRVVTGIYNQDKNEKIIVRIRTPRVPIVGDKFSSRAGQKGTIGMTLHNDDMPFTEDGQRPDIIINPHAIPSRMTMSQLLEMLVGKIAVHEGSEVDGTPFMGLTVEDVQKKLREYGYDEHGETTMYSGFTGEKLQAKIFFGPMFYQRLKHMVADKIHTRSKGPRQMLTRQPAEGRSRDGGFRCGEMERDGIIGHGVSAFLLERMRDVSDKFVIQVCRKCGVIAQKLKTRDIYQCSVCKSTLTISHVTVPYAFKLFFQEMIGMGIYPKMEIDTNRYITDQKDDQLINK